MKASDLRIGNIAFKAKTSEAYPLSANDITNFEYSTLMKPMFQPIPLTEEWLLRFGFLKMSRGWIENVNNPYWAKKSVLLFYTETPPENTYLGGFGFTHSCDHASHHIAATFKWINYVHQLQNLYFVLTSEELSIEE